MNKYVLGLAMSAAVLAAGLVAVPVQAAKSAPKEAGSLIVYGNSESKLFTSEGIDRAKSTMSGTQFDHGLHLTIDTYGELPENKKASFTALGDDKEKKAKFFKDWAHERATDEKGKGPFVLITRKPGHVEVVVDKSARDRGFSPENQAKLKDILLQGFQEAKDKPDAEQLKLRDNALKAAVDYVVADLKGTTVASTVGTTAAQNSGGGFWSKYGGYICIGIVGLLIVWVIIAVIRAMTGGGGGGGMGGGGGGGGGFMSSMMGGLFGAMAGMWLYNNLLGGGSMFGGSESSNGSYGDSGGSGGSTGDGDFSGDDGASGGGDFGGGGDGGGGDFGGGGGDWGGGGGDFGGGGGDF